MSSSSRKKKEGIFCTVYFVWRKFFEHFCFISVYSVLNNFSEYPYFNVSKNLDTLPYLFLKSSETFSVSLKPHRQVWDNFWQLQVL